MDKVKLAAKMRDVFGRRTKKGKKEGLVPAVVYGKKEKPKSLWVNALELTRLLRDAGESTIIELKIDKEKSHNVIIYEIQKDPVTDQFIHVDFFQVRMDEEIETEVELVYVGEAPAVKELGGVLVKALDEITVKCLPVDLPHEIQVDISTLKTFEDNICVKDLKVSDKVKFDIEPETVIATVSEPRSEEELESLNEKVEEDVSKVEGVVKETPEASGDENKEEKSSSAGEEKK